MVRLVPMTQEQYSEWLEASIREFAEERVRAGNATPEEAEDYSRRAFSRLLPQGLATPGQWLYSVESEEDGPVGVIWLGSGQEGLPASTGFIYDLAIAPAHRRKGYATQAMLLLEGEARNLGMDALALHVFGHNHAARALYERLGYEVTNLNMRKRLGDAAGDR